MLASNCREWDRRGGRWFDAATLTVRTQDRVQTCTTDVRIQERMRMPQSGHSKIWGANGTRAPIALG